QQQTSPPAAMSLLDRSPPSHYHGHQHLSPPAPAPSGSSGPVQHTYAHVHTHQYHVHVGPTGAMPPGWQRRVTESDDEYFV
ncbi:hypothetical protein, partial [Streptococcus pneumoniae]|uniref:hypothetical protein n=1 Tax=Streptococcus pneumoniae TaxID=1313 RepID=UPI001E6371EF